MKKLILILLAALFFLPRQGWSQGCMEPSGEEGIQIIGFIQPQYQYEFLGNDKITGDRLDSSAFYFNRARIGIMGSIPYDFSYYVMTEFSPTLNGGKNPKPPFLLDAFISYNRFAPYVKIAAGQFKSPFGLELGTPCHQLYTINRAMVTENLVHPWRDVGVMVSGGTGDLSILGSKTKNLFGYAFAVLNGVGINNWDDNNKKDIVGRLTFHPVEFLTLGASYRFGKHPAKVAGAEEDDSKKRFGFDAAIDYKGFIVQGEFTHGTDNGSYTTGGGCGGEVEYHIGSRKASGFFVQALYTTPWRIQPVVKFERFDPNLDMKADDTNATKTDIIQNTITYGFNYLFNDKVRLQVNYLYQAEENGKVEISNDGLLVQMQVVF